MKIAVISTQQHRKLLIRNNIKADISSNKHSTTTNEFNFFVENSIQELKINLDSIVGITIDY